MLGRLITTVNQNSEKTTQQEPPPPLSLPKCHKDMLLVDITETILTHNMTC